MQSNVKQFYLEKLSLFEASIIRKNDFLRYNLGNLGKAQGIIIAVSKFGRHGTLAVEVPVVESYRCRHYL